MSSPITVPAPTRVSSTLSLAVVMAILPIRAGRPRCFGNASANRGLMGTADRRPAIQPRCPGPPSLSGDALAAWVPDTSLTLRRGRSGGLGVLEHHGRALLADHDGGGIGVAADHLRHDGGVHDAQAANAVHPEARIDDGVGPAAHAAGADRVQV